MRKNTVLKYKIIRISALIMKQEKKNFKNILGYIVRGERIEIIITVQGLIKRKKKYW